MSASASGTARIHTLHVAKNTATYLRKKIATYLESQGPQNRASGRCCCRSEFLSLRVSVGGAPSRLIPTNRMLGHLSWRALYSPTCVCWFVGSWWLMGSVSYGTELPDWVYVQCGGPPGWNLALALTAFYTCQINLRRYVRTNHKTRKMISSSLRIQLGQFANRPLVMCQRNRLANETWPLRIVVEYERGGVRGDKVVGAVRNRCCCRLRAASSGSIGPCISIHGCFRVLYL